MLAIKAIVTIEAVGYILDPKMDLAKVSLPMMSEIFMGRISPMRMAKPVLRALPDYLDFLEQAPATILRTLGMVSSGKFQIEMVEKQVDKHPREPLWKLWIPFAALAIGVVLFSAENPVGGDVSLTRSLHVPLLSVVSFGVAAWYSIRYWRLRRA